MTTTMIIQSGTGGSRSVAAGARLFPVFARLLPVLFVSKDAMSRHYIYSTV